MQRAIGLARLASESFDVLVVGGGATGLGAAVDAAARGYRTALVESGDFASATSSRSTKLIHGGVRYLAQGEVGLVREALRERTRLFANAPHLVSELRFVLPAYRRRDLPYYGLGLKLYDAFAGHSPFAASAIVGARHARAAFPALVARGLRGAITYSDGSFDDARLAIALARTAVAHGAAVANYVEVTGFAYDGGRVCGAHVVDHESARRFTIRARSVINAAGIFVDGVRALDRAHAPRLLRFSRGTHIVVAATALGEPSSALLVPKTRDGRVVFALPWNGAIVIGTTDVAAERAERDPQPSAAEIAYLLATINPYLDAPLQTGDVRAAFAGLRPLVDRGSDATARLSREHLVASSPSGMVTIAGGKWTTYRRMAQDAVDAAAREAGLAPSPSRTATLQLHGASGSDARELAALAGEDASLALPLHPAFPYTRAQVVYAVRAEMARTVDDVLSRRLRATFLDAAAAGEAEALTARLIAGEIS